MRAAAEFDVRSPLMEAGFRKSDVRTLAEAWGLPVWDKPATPCLSSRIAYGVEVTPERVARVDAAERFLRSELGLQELRVRHEAHDLARIELPVEHLALLSDADLRERINSELRNLGFQYVTLDLEGFRSGSMNRAYQDPQPRQILRRFGIGSINTVDQEVKCEPVSGGFSAAHVYRVEFEEKAYALRRWPLDELPINRLIELHRFLQRAHATGGIPFAVPIPAPSTGETLVRQVDAWWQLEPWMPGQPASSGSCARSQTEAAVRMLARLHHFAATYQCTRGGRTWFSCRQGVSPAVEERLQILAVWQSRGSTERALLLNHVAPEARPWLGEVVEHFDRRATGITSALRSCASLERPLHPCLRDIWSAHVLFCDAQITGLIDANATRTEHPATDLARLLGSLIGNDGEAWESALDAYAAEHPLDESERELVRVLDQSGVLLSGMAWIERCARQEYRDINAVADRLRAIVERLEGLPILV
ncbi:Uncharacterized protein slr1717 [Durusdinium trenchii]|uniref:Uncharacterized protein slr1717 n=1 Tax=Durusdinium trenchii TaxID=1381693 RepID=A0ABP0RN35_9DINO